MYSSQIHMNTMFNNHVLLVEALTKKQKTKKTKKQIKTIISLTEEISVSKAYYKQP